MIQILYKTSQRAVVECRDAKEPIFHNRGLLPLSQITPIPSTVAWIGLWQPGIDEEGPDNSSAEGMGVHGHTRCWIHARPLIRRPHRRDIEEQAFEWVDEPIAQTMALVTADDALEMERGYI